MKYRITFLKQYFLFRDPFKNKNGVCLRRDWMVRSDQPKCFPLQGRKEESLLAIFPKDEVDRAVAQAANSVEEDDTLFAHGDGGSVSLRD